MALVAVALTIVATQSPAIKPLGAFDGFRYTTEHQYGYAAYLWADGGTLYGIFQAASGLAGDPPTGILEEGKYDQARRRVTFSVKLIGGVHGCPVHNDSPPKVLLGEFTHSLATSGVGG